MKDGWRFATMESGEQSVMIAGTISMHKLYADNWGSLTLVHKSYPIGMLLWVKVIHYMSSSGMCVVENICPLFLFSCHWCNPSRIWSGNRHYLVRQR